LTAQTAGFAGPIGIQLAQEPRSAGGIAHQKDASIAEEIPKKNKLDGISPGRTERISFPEHFRYQPKLPTLKTIRNKHIHQTIFKIDCIFVRLYVCF